MMFSMFAVTLVANAAAESYVWAGAPLTLDTASAWSGGNPVASAGVAASSTNFGTPGTDVMTASLSGSIAVGSTLTLTGAVQIVFSSPSATISFGTPSGTAMPATWLTLQPGFNAPAAPSTSATIGASAAPYDYNCPLNWRTASGSVPFDAPQNDDAVTIPSGGSFVTTFGNAFSGQSVNGLALSGVCAANPNGLSVAGSPPSTLAFGAQCASTSSAVRTSCGNLQQTVLPGTTPGTQVTLYTCAQGAPGCAMGGMAVLQNNNTDSAATVTATFNTATNTWTVPGTANTVVISGNGQPSAVAPSSSSDSGGGGGTLIIIIAIVAVVVALAVVAVIVLKKKGAQSSPDRGVAFGGVGFENPLYDDSTKEVSADADYMDLPEDVAAEGGYMDVPVEGGDGDAMYDDAAAIGVEGTGGYMDVSPEDEEGDY